MKLQATLSWTVLSIAWLLGDAIYARRAICAFYSRIGHTALAISNPARYAPVSAGIAGILAEHLEIELQLQKAMNTP